MYSKSFAKLSVKQRKEQAKNRKAETQQEEKVLKQKQCVEQVKRMQAYLGLNSKQNNDRVVTFFSIDVEAWEFDQDCITEIGISILSITPGAPPEAWMEDCRALHFLILENKHRVNRVNVEGNPHKFQFGESEYLSEGDVDARIHGLLDDLLMVRNNDIVLVGHDVGGDIKYLQMFNIDFKQFISDTIDTTDLHKAANRDNRSISLGNLLEVYNIKAQYLHNAGNDAYFTLSGAIAIAVDEHKNKKTAVYWQQETARRIEKACEEATARVHKSLEGWDLEDDIQNFQTLSQRQGQSNTAPSNVLGLRSCQNNNSQNKNEMVASSQSSSNTIKSPQSVPMRTQNPPQSTVLPIREQPTQVHQPPSRGRRGRANAYRGEDRRGRAPRGGRTRATEYWQAPVHEYGGW